MDGGQRGRNQNGTFDVVEAGYHDVPRHVPAYSLQRPEKARRQHVVSAHDCIRRLPSGDEGTYALLVVGLHIRHRNPCALGVLRGEPTPRQAFLDAEGPVVAHEKDNAPRALSHEVSRDGPAGIEVVNAHEVELASIRGRYDIVVEQHDGRARSSLSAPKMSSKSRTYPSSCAMRDISWQIGENISSWNTPGTIRPMQPPRFRAPADTT